MPHTKQLLLLGAHVSVAGGLELAYERGESIGCTAIQIFTKSNRQWHATKLTSENKHRFLEAQKKSSIQVTLTHASYLINLGAHDAATHKKSMAALAIELERCHELNIPYLVLHPGSRGTSDEIVCLDQIAESLNQILAESHQTTTILLENMAGQGSSVCSSFESLGYILNKTHPTNRIGVCLDTCHAFAAGYDFTTNAGYNAMWEEFDMHIGLNKLHAIHMNDSKKGCGSRVDRHEDIGKGRLGLSPFGLIMNDKKLAHIPKILETPRATLQDYVRNMYTLKSLLV